MPFPSELKFSSYLQFSPRGEERFSKVSRAVRDAVKNDQHLRFMRDGVTTTANAIDAFAASIAKDLDNFPFLKSCLGPDTMLVPIPRSAPLAQKDALWPSRRICEALVSVGLGAEVAPLLIRTNIVQKAAFAQKGERPDPQKHYDSTEIDSDVPMLLGRSITLVDDVVTRGASFVGMFRRISEAFPGRSVSCFALLRTISAGDIDAVKAPVEGVINYYPSQKLWREP